jgi:hypothetical protein
VKRTLIRNARLSYANVWKPRAINDNAEPSYSCSLLVDKNDKESLAAIKAGIKEAERKGKEQYGAKWKALRTPLRDGDTEDKGEAYKGHFFMNAKSRTKPGILKVVRVNGKTKQEPVLNEDEVYSGCYAHVTVEFYPYSASGNTGVACALGNILKMRDGEPLDGRIRAEDEFSEIEIDEDDLDDDSDDLDDLDDLLN